MFIKRFYYIDNDTKYYYGTLFKDRFVVILNTKYNLYIVI